jgi:2-oxoglutarate ferredoxin oxidoreductase subunit alpha
MEGADRELEGPAWYGPQDAEVTLLCWGSTYGPLREAVDWMNTERPGRANMLHFCTLYPFPVDQTEAALEQAKRTVVVEGNSTGQLETLLRAHTGLSVDSAIRRYDGRAFTPEFIVARMPEEA